MITFWDEGSRRPQAISDGGRFRGTRQPLKRLARTFTGERNSVDESMACLNLNPPGS
jgi:hypothetical protein